MSFLNIKLLLKDIKKNYNERRILIKADVKKEELLKNNSLIDHLLFPILAYISDIPFSCVAVIMMLPILVLS